VATTSMPIPPMGNDDPTVPSAVMEFADAVLEVFGNSPVIRAGAIMDQFREGELEPLAAIRALAPMLREQERLATVEQERLDGIKGMLRDAYTRCGERVITLPEHDLELTQREASLRTTADHKVVKRAIETLRGLGEPHLVTLAAELESGIKETQVAGGVVVGRPKKK